MKKTTLIIILLLLIGITSKSFAQKIEESKKDDFTGKSIKRTSWENLFTTMTANAYFRISIVGDDESFDLKYQDGSPFAIEADQELLLKLDDGEVLTLKNAQSTATCKGCGAKGLSGSGAEGIQVLYPMTKEQAGLLKAHKVVKVRITTLDKTFDGDVKDKNAEKIQACLNLL
jgi:hypothetical protein